MVTQLPLKFTDAESRYYTGEKELLAVIHALTVWRCYVDGSQLWIYSDHEPLKYLRTKNNLTPRQVRWSQFLERFDYNWEHREGRLNAADPLSRIQHGSITGSGVGSLTGKDIATDTVLEHLAALATVLSPESMIAALKEASAAVRRSTRGHKPQVLHSCDTPPDSPKRQRKRKAADAVEQTDTAEQSDAAELSDTVIGKESAVHESDAVMPSMRDKLQAAYKACADMPKLVASYGLTQRQHLWYKQGQIFVPDVGALRQECMSEHHDTPYAGHKGVTKTLDSIRRMYYWPGMATDVRRFVTTCSACQRNKVQGKKPIGLLQPLPVPKGPWEQVTMDFITGLPCTDAGYDAVLVFCDKFSKMVHFAACNTETDAFETAKLFRDRVFALHGMPESIVSDRDARFTGHFWKGLMKLLGVTHKLSTAFHPQTDGQTERVNRVLEEYLRHFVNPGHNDWDGYLALAEFAYNNSMSEATGYTPFFLNYGRHPRLPSEFKPMEEMPAADEFAAKIAEAVQLAKDRMTQAQQRAKKLADPARREKQFAAGDMVLLSSKNIALKTPGSNKLLPKYIGPFKVLQALGPVTYRLELPSSMKCHNVFHVSQLLEYKTDGREQAPPPALDFDDGEGGTWLEIETVLGHRTVKRGSREVRQYLVRWKGYGPEHDEWRDEAGVTEVATDEYWARVGHDAAPLNQSRRSRSVGRGSGRGRGRRGRGRR